MFSAKGFVDLGLIHRSLMQFEVIFVNGVRQGSDFIFFFFTSEYLVVQLPIMKGHIFPHCMVFAPWLFILSLCLLFSFLQFL